MYLRLVLASIHVPPLARPTSENVTTHTHVENNTGPAGRPTGFAAPEANEPSKLGHTSASAENAR